MKLDPLAFVANPELVAALRAHSIQVSGGGEYFLFRQGDPPVGLFIVNKGEVTLSMSSPTGELLLSMQVGAGSLLGLPGLIGNEPYTLSALACNGAELSFVTHDDFTALMHSDPGLALKVLQVLAAEVRSARHAAQDLRPLVLSAHRSNEFTSNSSAPDPEAN
ncbi:MAG: Crp/Fnr family transcriptional regulator [Terracidiphilus sp.]|jgi:CRP-like cAMP-binding protein